MKRQVKFLAGIIAMALAVSTVMSAQVPATVVLRSGETLSVTMMDLMGAGFQVRVNGTERMIPKDQVAMVDFGGNVTPQAAWFEGIGGLTHLVVLKNGDTLKTEWIDIGGATPLVLTFSGDRQMNTNEVARIYLTAPANLPAPATPAGGVQGDGAVAVNANDPWTNSGINVRTGEFLRFSVSREIRVGPGANDVAPPDGNPNVTTNSTLFRRLPVPDVPVGSLIGRVGNGRAFPIGSAPQAIRMPANGTLMLGVNDMTFNDNSGWFRVVVSR
ncbi:MAG TPA: hypothetical protein VMZ90_03350 [Vicinamibacterales bacterium]|nr:hypothetical protein [Vicinamibacterales bacterium]